MQFLETFLVHFIENVVCTDRYFITNFSFSFLFTIVQEIMKKLPESPAAAAAVSSPDSCKEMTFRFLKNIDADDDFRS